MLTSRQIADGLYDAGLRPGDSVMLHSSYKSLGGVEGGPGAVLDAFLDCLGRQGTLLVPTLLFRGSQYGFLSQYPSDVDLRNSPSRYGILTETLRTRPGAIRSIHATSPATGCGGRAAELCGRHHLDDTCVGINSPWARNAAAGGWVVLLGVPHDSNTTLHHLEEQCCSWLLMPEPFEVSFLDTAGQRRTSCLRSYRANLPRDYPKVEPILLQAGVQRNVMIGTATVRIMRAAAVLECIGRIVRQDPYFLLKDPRLAQGPAGEGTGAR
jgi:aminoglycoside 3-N-acetyltransferase